jgi:hypothetical protein
MTLESRVREAKERLHRSIGQRARWALADFRRDLRVLEGQALFLRGLTSNPVDLRSR